MKLFGSEKVKKLPIFANIEGNIIEEILTHADKENFSSGETIMEQGDQPNGK